MLNIKFINATSVQLRTVGSPKQIEYTMGSESSPIFSCSNNFFSKDDQNYYYFAISGQNVQLSGQITEVTEDYQFFNLFRDQPAIKDASKLILSAPSVKKFSYANMFLDCQNLTSPPTVEATSLDQWCYSSMFGNCYKLATAPALIATILAKYCYYCMFYNCWQLVESPTLPAETLTDWCYNSMFYNCQNLSCIASQFTAWSPSNATTNWVTRVAQNGWFNNQNITEVYGVDNIPSGWSIEQPQPPAPDPTISIAPIPDLIWDFETNTTSSVNLTSYITYSNGTGTVTYDLGGTLANGVVFNNGILSANKDLMEDDFSQNFTLSASATDITSTATEDFSLTISGVYQQPPVPVGDPLTFTAKKAAHIALNSFDFASAITLKYSKNNGDWTNYTVGTQIDLASGDTLAFYGNNDHFSHGNGYYQFQMTGLVEASGNIQSLMNYSTSATHHCYRSLFESCSGLLTAPQLPATTLADACYQNMFNGCSNLSSAPQLPATTLTDSCYWGMFGGCTKLSSAPVLSATSLADYCYCGMFFSCSSFVSFPADMLPATTLATECYKEMFAYCQQLTSAPNLPATDLAPSCYQSMFYSCINLTDAPQFPATGLATGCYAQMFEGCTALTAAPVLSATTLANNCYMAMFSGCTALSTAPELPATNLAQQCYEEMFWSCSSLLSAPVLSATTLADGCYYNMFNGCYKLSTASNLPATSLASACYYGMYSFCSSLVRPPTLPASTLTNYCYGAMFHGCKSLTGISNLPATTLVEGCYQDMFNGCSSLSSIKVNFTDWNDVEYSTSRWVTGVRAHGSFHKPNALPNYRGDSYIPQNWTLPK